MAQVAKAKVFMIGGSQAVIIPAEYHFRTAEVYIRRDPKSRGVILSEAPSWNEIFAALDEAGVPDDFMGDRDQVSPQEREEP